eukprot:gene18975-biopygen23455
MPPWAELPRTARASHARGPCLRYNDGSGIPPNMAAHRRGFGRSMQPTLARGGWVFESQCPRSWSRYRRRSASISRQPGAMEVARATRPSCEFGEFGARFISANVPVRLIWKRRHSDKKDARSFG